MHFDIIIYTLILALINFPVVIAVERHTNTRPVKKVYGVAAADDQRQWEIRNSLLTTPIHAVLFFVFMQFGWLSSAPETFGLVIATFLITFAWTEIWHYASHIAMHQKWLHFIHKEHHKSKVTTPWSSVSFSLGEKFIFSLGILGFLAIVSKLMALSTLGVFIYYILYFFTNTLGHANFEFRKPQYRKSFMGKLFNSPSYHAMHHARYIRNYGLLTPWLDGLFNTKWEDESEVQTRAAQGDSLKRLGERLTKSAT